MRCVDCRGRLIVHHLLESYHLEVDVCADCGGVWVEHDEVEKVAHSAELREALARMNERPGLKSWLFQFFSQFPLEYNIKPRRLPVITFGLIALNVIFFLMYQGDDFTAYQVLSGMGLTPSAIAAGERPWSLLTHMFLHAGWGHLIGNMYFLYLVGDNIEDALGRLRYLGVYIGLGLVSAAVSLLANLDSSIPSVGASGAIAGLFGLYILWFRNASLTFMFIVWQKKLSATWYFVIWLAINLFGMVAGGEGVDYWAHVGGFAAGIACGFALKPWVFRANPTLAFLASQEAQVQR